jgi:GH24 family phage-related lysozyme (muramidase)
MNATMNMVRRFWRDLSGDIRKWAAVTAVGGVLLASIAASQWSFTMPKEGMRHTVYFDSGHVATVCVGHTGADIDPSHYYTTDECNALYDADMQVKVDRPLSQCLHPPAPLPSKVVIVVRDFTFNVGAGAACSSTMMRLLNSGDTAAACQQFPRWAFVNTTFIPGLMTRRVSEQALCLEGLK